MKRNLWWPLTGNLLSEDPPTGDAASPVRFVSPEELGYSLPVNSEPISFTAKEFDFGAYQALVEIEAEPPFFDWLRDQLGIESTPEERKLPAAKRRQMLARSNLPQLRRPNDA